MLRSVLLIAALTACGVDAASPASPAAPSNDPVAREVAPADTVLATVRLSTTHIVEFTETTDGYRDIVEDLDSDHDRDQRSIAQIGDAITNLADVHRYLLPGASVPAALIDSDARAAQRIAEPADQSGPPENALQTDEGVALPAEDSILWDWNADALWFKQYFYTEGTDGIFAANYGWYHVTKKRKTDFYKASAFNQSFESPAHFRVDRSRKCGFLGLETCWDTKLDKNVANRHVMTYKGDGPKYRKAWMDGNGPTARVGLAVRWTPVTYWPTSPAPECGGHTQLACSWGCNAGLVQYNGGCYACGTHGQACCLNWGDTPTNGGWQGVCAQGVCGYPDGYCH